MNDSEQLEMDAFLGALADISLEGANGNFQRFVFRINSAVPEMITVEVFDEADRNMMTVVDGKAVSSETADLRAELLLLRGRAAKLHADKEGLELVAERLAAYVGRLESRVERLQANLASAEALMNRIAFGIIQSGYSPKRDSNNPMEDWLQRLAEWKAAAPEQEPVL